MRSMTMTILLVLGLSMPAAAQDSTKVLENGGWMDGISLGMPGYGSEVVPQLFTLGFTFTQFRANRLVPDGSIGTMPYAIGYGVLPVGVRAGVAFPIVAAPHLLVIPSGGLSFVAAIGPGGGGGLVGTNAGLATIVHGGATGMRLGVTYHAFDGLEAGFWLLEFGVVSVPARSR